MVVRMPLVAVRSLKAIGTPCNGPISSPVITACSAATAFSRASSGQVRQKALIVGSTSSMRASAWSISSTGEISLARMRRASSVAGVYASAGSVMIVLSRVSRLTKRGRGPVSAPRPKPWFAFIGSAYMPAMTSSQSRSIFWSASGSGVMKNVVPAMSATGSV